MILTIKKHYSETEGHYVGVYANGGITQYFYGVTQIIVEEKIDGQTDVPGRSDHEGSLAGD